MSVYGDPPECPRCGMQILTPASIMAETCWNCGEPLMGEDVDDEPDWTTDDDPLDPQMEGWMP